MNDSFYADADEILYSALYAAEAFKVQSKVLVAL